MTQKMDLLGRLELQVVRDPSTGNRKVVFRNQDGELLDPEDNPELMATLGAGGVTQADLSAALATKANAASLAAKVDTAAMTAAISAQHTVDNATYARNAKTAFRAGRRWLFSGTSITAGTGSSNAGTTAYAPQALLMAGTYYARGDSYNGGTAGTIVSAQLAALPARLANNPDAVFIEVGPNDSSDANATALASFQASVTGMVALAKAAGLPVVVTTPTPRSTAVATSGTRLRTNQQAQWLRLYAASSGIYLADFYAALADPATGDLLAAYDSGDGLHPSELGHQRLGQVAADAMRAAMGGVFPVPVSAKGLGLANNPLMVANVTVPANSFGVTATGDAPTLTLEADTTGRIPAGQWAKEVWSTVASAVTYTRGMTLSATLGSGYAVGDSVALTGYIEVTDAASRWESDVAAATAGARLFVRNQSAANVTAMARCAGRRLGGGVYAIGPFWNCFTVPSLTSMDLTYNVTLPVGAAATIRFAAYDLINLTTLGIPADASTGMVNV